MNDYTSDPDYALIQAMAAGDVAALNELYTRHGANILNYLTSLLHDRQQAEEVLQDVMLAAWEHAGSFRGESKVRTWLLTIARHRAINAQRRLVPDLVMLDETTYSTDTTPLEKVERQTQRQNLQAAIQQLPPFHQEILVLIFYHQLSGPEVAEVLGVTVGTVKSRLHRAKAMLRRVLQSMGENTNAQ
ncbi:MAG TPA: RNA polymerase sigma factor [Phototrophicaceae bacterium]|nr:RNA polymerase sigma factor [Phototrophicaceae bacterium]